MPKQKNPLDKLLAYGTELGDMQAIRYILEWDSEVNMPSDGAPYRVRLVQKAHADIHKMGTSSRLQKLLDALIDLDTGEVKDASLSPRIKSLLRESRRDYLNAKKIPASLVKKEAKITAEALQAWKPAKEQDNFKLFRPHLEKMVDVQRKKAEHLGLPGSPYTSLLDLYEPEMKAEELDNVFREIRPKLQKLIASRSEKDKAVNTDCLKGHFPLEAQRKLTHEVILAMGIKKSEYALGECAHPFLLPLNPKDARINTKFYEDDFTRGFFATVHEAGHAYYELNLPEEYFGTPLAQAVSLGIHESQSRYWECYIGQSFPFSKFFYPKIQAAFPKVFGDVSLETYHNAINAVKPSYIRIFADELTYPMHVIMRYELERAMIEGTLAVKDLPEAWNTKVQDYLGLPAPKLSEGCLQDIHWGFGLWGYFPTYSLGTMFAGSLFSHMTQEHTDWDARVAKGDLQFVADFLKETVHQYGREYNSLDLIKHSTGKAFDTSDYFKYLEGKYSG